ncbi:MAG: class I SAM-dependent methyltransferase [Rhodocyclaceae bacterium]|nr:class I SAM-dependent methyltransferase [Rhodocyclaceae bacterium]
MNCPCCASAEILLRSAKRLSCACAACGHQWQSHPTAAPIDYRQLSGRNIPDAAAHQAKLDDRLTDIAPLLFPNLKVLEIGCAEGSLAACVMARGAMHYSGIELSGDALAAEKILHRVIREPATKLHGEVFDLLLSFHVLEHINDITAEVGAWRSLLGDAGVLLVEVPNQAGHPLLSDDPNVEHLHQFTTSSLSALLDRAGFAIERMTCGHFESAVYSDSLRVIARPCLPPESKRAALVARFRQALNRPFAIWGIGGDYHSYVAPWISEMPPSALIDSNAARHGEEIGGNLVESYDPYRHKDLLILVASLRYSSDIARDAKSCGVAAESLVYLADIYGLPRHKRSAENAP